MNQEEYDLIVRIQGTSEGQKLYNQLSEREKEEVQLKSSTGRERCHECGIWSGGWISDWDDGRMNQVCPECSPKFLGRHMMVMYDIKKLHEQYPYVPSWDPNFSLNRYEKMENDEK